MKVIFFVIILLCGLIANGQKKSYAPLFIDPNYHGSCDPEVIYNVTDKFYYIYYTARRSLLENNFVATPIGVIRSKNLKKWDFLGYLKIDGIGGTKDAFATYWAPAIVQHNDTLHAFITYKPDTNVVAGPWGGPGQIVHYRCAANNPINGWKKVSEMHSPDIDALDATAYLKNDTCHVWFKGKRAGDKKNELYHVISADFDKWIPQGFSKSDVFNKSASGSDFEEAPYLFFWKNRYWLITDPHKGLFVYVSNDAMNWKFQGTILEKGGTRNLDNTMSRHCSVIIKNERAFIVYHVEPWRRYDLEAQKGEKRLPIFKQPKENRRSVLQIAN